MALPPRLRLPSTPVPPAESQVLGSHFRVTVLTERLLRLEYSPTGEFEDRATQTVINRDFPPVPFRVRRAGESVQVSTPALELDYDGGPFTAAGLSARLVGQSSHRSLWRYGTNPLTADLEPANLGGTARTLDGVDGATPLDDGLMGRFGWAVLDDSGTMALTDAGWVADRIPGNRDLYLFAYSDDYRACLADFYRLTGPQPLLPRFALGNWWSRYHPYTDAEYRELIERFAAERLPFSVAVIDMDWHLVDIPAEFGTGWTGYTWNRALFPDPEAFLAWLHERGLKVTLNVHPADGVRTYEDCYPAMARAMGIDPASRQPVAFDIADPEFLIHYFEQVHHPLEDAGVDFWWLDWQQGTLTSIPGLDPLWMLNHFHFLDSARRGTRPLTFSRYAGPGSHRYPVGFSGDTVNSWDSLAFQPFFTATAANVGYGWWSHDIGGHMWGYRSEELVTRWFQLGTFSPINRLHSTLNPFAGKEPWKFNAVAERVMGDFLRLRHRLLPYLYSMNERAHRLGEPLVTPLYYGPPSGDPAHPLPAGRAPKEAYGSPNTFYFGDQLLVAAITAPLDPALQLGSVLTWLPDGLWTDWFTGVRYDGGRHVRLHRPLAEYPVLAKAGAIVPLTADGEFGLQNPATLTVRVFAGADGWFELYEDDDAADPRSARTTIRWDDTTGRFSIGGAVGDLEVIPARRSWDVRISGVAETTVPGLPTGYDPATATLTVRLDDVPSAEGAEFRVARLEPAEADRTARLFELLARAEIAYATKDAAWALIRDGGPTTRLVARLQGFELEPALRDALLELVLARL